MAESGYLLAKVTSTKLNEDFFIVGVNSGFNHLIRPTLYGSYHEIINGTKKEEREKEKVVANICGNICESGDWFIFKFNSLGLLKIDPSESLKRGMC